MARGHTETTEPRHGIWWIAGKPENQVTGTLTRVDDEWQLLVHGVLRTDQKWSQGLSTTPATIIHGMSGHTVYTLYQAYYRGGTAMPMANTKREEPFTDTGRGRWQQWWGVILLKGAEVDRDTLFTSASFELTGLNAWWPETALPQATDFDTYKSPPSKVANWHGTKVTLGMSIHGSTGQRLRHLSESVSVHVDRPDGFTFDWLRSEIITPFQGVIAAFRPCESDH
jgi:hypothetical protein